MAPSAFFYAVRKGRKPGIYSTWAECELQTKGFIGAQYKRFPSKAQAEEFIQGAEPTAAPVTSNADTNVSSGSSSSVRVEEPGWDVVYSDGACKGNGKAGSIAGIGVWWGPNDPRNIAERCPGDQTNNRAELIAILRVLEETPVSKKPLRIKTDSQYSINCFERWIGSWKRNGWRSSSGAPVKNVGVIRLIDAHLMRRDRLGQRVNFTYVKGHSGDIGNDGADYQANLGAMLPPAAERDWEREEELLKQEQQNPMQAIAEAPVAMPVGSKRSRSPPRRLPEPPNPKNVAAPKTPSRSTALRLAAIEEALKSPPLNSPSKKKRIETTPVPEAPAESSRHALSTKPIRQVAPQALNCPPKKLSRIALLEAALTGDIEPPAINAKNPSFSLSATASNLKTKSATFDLPGPMQQADARSVRVIYALPPLVPVRREEVNPEDYADCLLSDEELLNEI